MSLKDNLTRNIGWKIAGIALALFLWFHLATEKIYEKTYDIGIETTGLPAGLMVEKIEPDIVGIVIIGTGKQLISLSLKNDIKILIDLSNISSPGQYEHKFSPLDIFEVEPHSYDDLSFPYADRCLITIAHKI